MPTTMTDDGDEEDALPPLTRNGYQRAPETEADIRKVARLRGAALVDPFRQSDDAAPDYLKSEALVFFIRRHRRDNDRMALSVLHQLLVERCQSFFEGAIRGFDEDTRIDLRSRILAKLTELLMAEDDRGDFLQVCFWVVVQRLTKKACGQESKRRFHYPRLDDHADDPDADRLADAAERVAAPGLSPEDSAILSQALAVLPDDLRQLFILRHMEGWTVGAERREDEKPGARSLAVLFDVSSKTIQKRLKKAEQLLAGFRRE